MTDETSRRDVLQRLGAGVGGVALATGSAAASHSDRYIVGTSTPAAAAAARRSAASVHRELDFGQIGQAIAGEFPAEAREALQRRPGVRYVEPDAVVHAIAETVPWGVDRVDADEAHAMGETGGDSDDGEGGADVAIIDTGIDDDHPDLNANVGTGRAFVDCQGSNCNFTWSDDNNHGTHCGGIADAEDNTEGVVGVSTAATLHAAKVLDQDGAGYASDVAAGIEWVANQGYDVGSLSLGTSSSITTIKDACQYAYGEGVLLVAAAGNDGACSDCVGYPAAHDTVVAVSATTSDDSLASFSSTGPEVELAAPGARVYSTVIGGYDSYSGTSMSCPHVAGAGAQLMDNGYSNTEARQRLTDTAEDIGLSSDEQGSGLLDVEAALGSSTDDAPTVSWANPTEGASVSGNVTVQIAADDDNDSGSDLTVEWQLDGGSWRTASYNSTSGYYEDSWDTSGVADGDYVLDARATDTSGNTSAEASVSVTVSNTSSGPTVSWVNPTDGDSVGGDVSIQVAADDDNDSGSDLTVEWQLDGGSWRTASYNSSSGYYEDSWDTNGVADGDYVLDARATDSAGNVSDEGRASVTVSNTSTGPTVDAYSVTEAGSPNPHASITADWTVGDADGDLNTVSVEVVNASEGSLVGSNTHGVGGTSASGTDSFEIKHSRNETFDVTLTVTDAAGNAASATRSVSE